jgi:hypothetical protein
MNNTNIFDFIWLKFWFQKNLRKKIVFESSVLAWIRIRKKSIRIHNPAFYSHMYGLPLEMLERN